jgi:signal transduction histidine kinase
MLLVATDEVARALAGEYGHGPPLDSWLNFAALASLSGMLALTWLKNLRAGLAFAIVGITAVGFVRLSTEGLSASSRYFVSDIVILAVTALNFSRSAVLVYVGVQSLAFALGHGVDTGALWPPATTSFGKTTAIHWPLMFVLLSGILLRFRSVLHEALSHERLLSDQYEQTSRALAAELAERKKADVRLQVLDRAGILLSDSLEYEQTLAQVLEVMVNNLADWCRIDLVQNGAIRSVAARHSDPEKQRVLERLMEDYPLSWGAPQPAVSVLKSGQPLFLAEGATDQMNSHFTWNPDHLARVRSLGTESAIVLPLEARGRVLGALSMAQGGDGRYTQEDFSLAQELGRRASVAIDRALLYQQVQDALQLREELVTLAAHELNTPVTVLLTSVQHLKRRGEQSNLPEHSLRLIERQGRRLSQLIETLFAALDIGRKTLTPVLQDINLTALAQEVVAKIRDDVPAHGSVISLDVEPVCGKWDGRFLRLALEGLLGNALKFGQDRSIEVKVGREGACALLQVVDHGMGVSHELLPQLFERFKRGVPSRNYGGMGLGLYVVQGLVSALGGRVEVNSELGAGATFTVRLPYDASGADLLTGSA